MNTVLVKLKKEWFKAHSRILDYAEQDVTSTWKCKKINDTWYLSIELLNKHSNRPFHIHISDIERIVGKYDKFLDKLGEL